VFIPENLFHLEMPIFLKVLFDCRALLFDICPKLKETLKAFDDLEE